MGRPKGSGNVPWDAIVAQLREHPDRWMLLPEMAAVPERTVEVIRRRERRALRLTDGVIRCTRTHSTTIQGRTTVTLQLKFSPKEKP